MILSPNKKERLNGLIENKSTTEKKKNDFTKRLNILSSFAPSATPKSVDFKSATPAAEQPTEKQVLDDGLPESASRAFPGVEYKRVY